MPAMNALSVAGDAFRRRLSLTRQETLDLVRRLRDQALPVVQFGAMGWDCEIDGTQIFRATLISDRVTENSRYHVVLNGQVFPDV